MASAGIGSSEATLGRFRAEIAQAKSTYTKTEADLGRTQKLIAANSISQSEFDQTQEAFELAKSELFKPVLGWWLTSMQAISVKRGQSDSAALDAAVASLKQNHVMIVFPEGHRSGTGKLQKGRGGAVRMALRAGVPIVPVAIHGVEKGIGAPITITYGKAWQPISQSGVINIDPDEMTALTDEMMCHIAEMLPAEYHGYYTDMMQQRKG